MVNQQESFFLVLFLIAAMIAGLVYAVRALSDSDGDSESSAKEPITEMEYSKPKEFKPVSARPSETTTAGPEEKKYVTVYQFSLLQPFRRCSHCDGENPADTGICRICGSEIDN